MEIQATQSHVESSRDAADTSKNSARVPRVAVIGVHGIARHPAGETENSMADLLLSLPKIARTADVSLEEAGCKCGGLEPDDGRKYTPFKAVGIHIPLQRVKTRPVISKKTGVASLQEESALFSTHLAARLTGKLEDPEGKDAFRPESADGNQTPRRKGGLMTRIRNQSSVVTPAAGTQTGNDYTGLLLDGYCGGADSNVYITTRLEGMRNPGSTPDPSRSKVHIYEVLWADLAHPASNILGFFLSLFTLLMHLASLSQKAVDTGSYENSGLLWSVFLWAQRWAVRFLQIFLPLLKVLLLVVFLSALPGVSTFFAPSAKDGTNPNAFAFAVVLGVLGGIGAVFAGYFIGKRVKWLLTLWPRFLTVKPWPWTWALSTMVPGIGGGLLGLALAYTVPPQFAVSILCWLVLGTPIIAVILSQYEGWRNGVQFWGLFGYGMSFVTFLYLSRFAHQPNPMLHNGYSIDVSLLAFWMTELGVAAIRIAWLVMSLMAILALVTGSLVSRLQRDTEKKARLIAAVRTSRFALAMPTAFFLMVTPLIWGAMFKLADWVNKPFFVLGGKENLNNSLTDALTQWHLIPNIWDPEIMCGDYFKVILAWGMGYQMPITLLLVTLAICVLVWWVTPSVLVESFQLRNKAVPPRTSTNNQSRALGSWLSRGLDATSVVTFLFWCSVFLALPAVYVLGLIHTQWAQNSFSFLKTATDWIVDQPLLAVAGAAVVGMFKYGSDALETVLDVDTYLRMAPDDATPRAKIFERFVSTLRYVANYRDEDGHGYDKVVIVAHSLGSLIAADLLRYLYVGQRDPMRHDPALERYGFAGDAGAHEIELKLLTMGAPIRQLLNRFFPYLYDWVRPIPDNSLDPLGHALLPQGDPGSAYPFPDPSELGVSQWANTYRSGDYVGRSLWLDEWYNRTDEVDPPGQQFGNYPQPIHVASSPSGDRIEMCIGAGAHTRYWDDTAPVVAEQLDRMI